MFQRFKNSEPDNFEIGTDTDRRDSPQLQKERSRFSCAALPQHSHVFARFSSDPRLYSMVSAIRSGCCCLTIAIFRQGVFLSLPGKMGH